LIKKINELSCIFYATQKWDKYVPVSVAVFKDFKRGQIRKRAVGYICPTQKK